MGRITGDGTAVTGLGGSRGYGETELPRRDDTLAQVDVSAVFEDGFVLDGVHYDANQLFISTDGVISFGSGVSGVVSDLGSIAAPFFAIFHADVDTRLDGEGAESGGVWLDVDPVEDCVTVTWDHVGFYRRNATLVNTFQIQLFDRGHGGFEVVFRYEDVTWTSGDLQGGWGGLGGLAALLGLRGATSGLVEYLAASGDESALLALAAQLGNTGITGLWQWDFTQPNTVIGTAANDTLAGSQWRDDMRGLGGDDLFRGSAGADSLLGGAGEDCVDYSLASWAIRLDLADPGRNLGQARGDVFQGIESFAGSAFNDVLLGGGGTDWFLGLSGADRLDGRGGDDRLDGGQENDSLSGGEGNDLLSGAAGGDLLAGGAGADRLDGGEGADRLFGGAGADILKGDGGADWLVAGPGPDILDAGPGADQLWGGLGDDRLNGEGGDDMLSGGGGADLFCHGGTTSDGTDVISDFRHAQGDRLVFLPGNATAADFAINLVDSPAMGDPAIKDIELRYVPTGQLLWTILDGATLAHLLVQSSMNSFDLL